MESELERTLELRGLVHYLMTVREEEKARTARVLHDEIGSSLTAVNMDLMSVRQRLGGDSPLVVQLERAADTLKSTVGVMRRIIEEIRPSMLESLGLCEAIRSWAKDYAAQFGASLAIDIPDELPPLPAGFPISLFRILQEALTNAFGHAAASSIGLTMRVEGDRLVVLVVDDGVGIVPSAGGAKHQTHGLLGIRERAIAMGGACAIGGGSAGRGTEVRVTVPVAVSR